MLVKNCNGEYGKYHEGYVWCKACGDNQKCADILWESNKCPNCLGSGKIQDKVYDWHVEECFICKGTGKRPEWYEKLYGKISF